MDPHIPRFLPDGFSWIEPQNLLQLIGRFLESFPLSRKSQVSHRTQNGPHQYLSHGGELPPDGAKTAAGARMDLDHLANTPELLAG